MQHHERVTDQSPVIRIPIQYHRRAKAFAAMKGVSLREAICHLIDQVCPTCIEPAQTDPRQLTIPGADLAAKE